MGKKQDTQEESSSPEELQEHKKQSTSERKPGPAATEDGRSDARHAAAQETAKDERKTEPEERRELKDGQTVTHKTHHPHKSNEAEHAHHAHHRTMHGDHASHHEQSHHAQPKANPIGSEGKANPNYWKIAAFVLGIAFLVTLVAQNMGVDTPEAPAAPTQQGEDAVAPEGAPQLADTSADPEVTLTVVNDPSCASCDTSQVLAVLTGQVFPKTTVKEVDVNSDEGQALVAKYEIIAVPAYLYERDVEDSANFGPVAEAMLDKGDAYLIHPAATGAGKYLNPPDEDDDPVLGEKDAPVTIVEFSDFECPFCKRFHDETLPRIKEQYIRTGKVRFVYRDFPLPIHPNAQKAAQAAECADDQGQFWAYHDKLFENQQALGVEKLKEYARELGLDGEAFDACLDSGKYANEVNADLEDGADAGVSGTPAFFIDGELVSGAQPFEVFAQVIDSALEE